MEHISNNKDLKREEGSTVLIDAVRSIQKKERWMSYASVMSHRGSLYLDVVFWIGAV